VAEAKHPHAVAPEELGFETIVYEKSGHRATVTLDRPEVLNSLDEAMVDEFHRALDQAHGARAVPPPRKPTPGS